MRLRRPPGGSAPTEVRDAARRELIGLGVRVVESTDPHILGVEGRVVDESRNTFTIARLDGREVRVAKRGNAFAFAFPEGSAVLRGDGLSFAPEDRIKKIR